MMRTRSMTSVIAAVAVTVMLLLSGCAPRVALDTPELRTQAVKDRFARLAQAMNAHDVEAINGMACEAGARPIIPSSSVTEGDVPLDVIVDGVRPIGSDDIDLDGESATAEFQFGSLHDRDVGDDDVRVSDEAIVRVDDDGACLWAMGPGLMLFMLL